MLLILLWARAGNKLAEFLSLRNAEPILSMGERRRAA
jgi:hypothetical protein